MRKAVLTLTAVLAASGLLLTFFAPLQLDPSWRKWASLLHIWGGVLFLAVFTLYAWEHIPANRRWLRIAAQVTFTGDHVGLPLSLVGSGMMSRIGSLSSVTSTQGP